MSLSSAHLDAFAEVAKTGSFSRAARNLHITQSALSQRIINLEHDLSTALIIREPSGLRLTAAGEEILRFHQAKSSLEAEALSRINKDGVTIGGAIRIGSFSSLSRSIVMPSISPIVTKHPQVSIEILTRELREVTALLISNQADFILTTHDPEKQDIEAKLVGHEEYVLIEPEAIKSDVDVYFDHDADDQTTIKFFKQQAKQPKHIRRSFLDEAYAIIDAVELGWGRAVLPKHLMVGRKKLRMCRSQRPIKIPVYLCRYKQPYYSKLHELVWAMLMKNVPLYLHAKSQ